MFCGFIRLSDIKSLKKKGIFEMELILNAFFILLIYSTQYIYIILIFQMQKF